MSRRQQLIRFLLAKRLTRDLVLVGLVISAYMAYHYYPSPADWVTPGRYVGFALLAVLVALALVWNIFRPLRFFNQITSQPEPDRPNWPD